jgi:hypothetical protein
LVIATPLQEMLGVRYSTTRLREDLWSNAAACMAGGVGASRLPSLLSAATIALPDGRGRGREAASEMLVEISCIAGMPDGAAS